MQSQPGTYVLVLRSNASTQVRVGRRGILQVMPGTYLYVGSAFGPGGVAARVERHCRTSKARRWHIDFLRERTVLESAWFSHAPERLEHRWAAALEGCDGLQAIAGFGCSDCQCTSHLFYAAGGLPPRAPLSCLGRGVGNWNCNADAYRR
jgi:Uri superfamily endonuclease